MKKFTLIALVFFAGIIVAIFGYGLLFSSRNSSPSKISTTQQASSSTDKSKTNFTIAEVAKHTNVRDCYLVINSKVYNVSSFINNHPGGVRKITDNCGKEVTGIFAAIHSNFAWDLLTKYYIGDLK